MPDRKDPHRDLRVVLGGKSGDGTGPGGQDRFADLDKLLARAGHYRELLSEHPDQEARALVTDLIDAIEALRSLMKSGAPDAQQRAIEYRRLVADLEIEIVAALQTR